MRNRTLVGALLLAMLGGLVSLTGSNAAAKAESPLPGLTAGWFETMNWYRAASGVKPVTQDVSLSKALGAHLEYLINTDKVLRVGGFSSPHTENPASPYYTKEGEGAGKASNIISDARAEESEAGAIDAWMTAPFHAIGILREALKSSALATSSADTGRTFWGLNIVAGLTPGVTRTKNIFFPGDDSTVRLSRFTGESPEPREGCPGDYKNYTGLPIFASLLKDPTKDISVELTGVKGERIPEEDVCVQTQDTFKSTDAVMGPAGAQSFKGENLVIIIPRDPLVKGTYKVKIKQGGVPDVGWSFGVEPAPAEGIASGIPEQKFPVRRALAWSLGSAVSDYSLTSQRVRIWDCPENKCTTKTLILDRSLPTAQKSIDISSFKDAFYFVCIEPMNASGVGKCTYQIIRVVNSCDITTCFVGSTWGGPESRCWQTSSTGVLEELRGKSWVKVAQSNALKGKCTNPKYPYSYVAKYSVKTVGEKTFRWRILSNGKVLGLTLPTAQVQFLSKTGV